MHINNKEENILNFNSELSPINSEINRNCEKEERNNEKNKINEINKFDEKMMQLSKDLKPKKKSYKYQPYKFSNFYKLSKNRNVSARNIYQYYISQEYKDKVSDPINNFTKFIEKKYRKPKIKFNKLYGINKPYLLRLKELKDNNSIAYKDDFDLKEYQNVLCGMIRKRVRSDNIYILKEEFKKFNEKLNKGFISHKGRFTQLAEKIRYNALSFLIDKLKN